MANKQSVFDTLNKIDVSEHVETVSYVSKKGRKVTLKYLSWAWAWFYVKKSYPDATYTIYENSDGMNYFTDGRTGWVKTGVTIEGIEYIEYLPIMDRHNNSILIDNITSFDVNKSIQRSLTKACARHGLGLYIYAGEDLPAADFSITPEQIKLIQTLRTTIGMTDDELHKKTKCGTLKQLSEEQAQKTIDWLRSKAESVEVPA